ncbi:MAG: ABC transporter substrate-binding protein [Corynebacterium sp.]|nr:ABC transporter substrate-binding protein [Corynebacterium sp.]
MHHRRLCAAAALSSLVLGVTACSAGHTAVVKVTDSPGLTLASTSPAGSLDFTTTGGAAIPAALMDNVYETLVTVDPDSGELIPRLAREWSTDSTGKIYTFNLQPGVTFSNGDTFDAHTAAFSIEYARDSWTNGIAKQLAVVESARAVDDLTVEVRLAAPSQSWLWAMTTAVGAMMTPSAIADLATHPVGTGPFVVSDFSPAEFISLTPNPHYWAAPAAQPVTIQYFPDAISSLNALQAGSVDSVWAVQAPELLSTLPQQFSQEIGTTNGEVLLSMNNSSPLFSDVRVRQAVAFGVDREALNQVMWDGLGRDTGGAPYAPTDPWFKDTNYYPYDVNKAKQLLADANMLGARLTLTTPTIPYAQTAAELLYSQLREIGFDVHLESAEFPAVWLSQVMGAQDYDMSLIAHVEPRDIPQLFGNPHYYLRYDSPRTRQLLAAADAAATEEEFTATMSAAVDDIMANAGALTLMNMPNIVVTRPGVVGLEPTMVTDAIALRGIRDVDANV